MTNQSMLYATKIGENVLFSQSLLRLVIVVLRLVLMITMGVNG